MVNTFDCVQASFTLSVFAAISSVIFVRCMTATVYTWFTREDESPKKGLYMKFGRLNVALQA